MDVVNAVDGWHTLDQPALHAALIQPFWCAFEKNVCAAFNEMPGTAKD